MFSQLQLKSGWARAYCENSVTQVECEPLNKGMDFKHEHQEKDNWFPQKVITNPQFYFPNC